MRTVLYPLILAVGLLLLSTGCRSVPVAGECPENSMLRCMSARICDWDEKRGCQRCGCEGTWRSDPYRAVEEIEKTGHE
jgi:hypothetical protein